MSIESGEPTRRQERYGGAGINSVYENNFVHTALADSSVTCIVEFSLCFEGVLCSYVTAKKKRRREPGGTLIVNISEASGRGAYIYSATRTLPYATQTS